MSAQRDYFASEDCPGEAPDVDPLEWARYWNARGSVEDAVSFTLIDIAASLRRIVEHLDRKDTTP